jgi:zinc transporter ZupT
VVNIKLDGSIRKVIPVMILAILIAFTLPALGQEEEEEQEELDLTTIFYLTSSMDMILSSSQATGSMNLPDFRLITGGGSEVIGIWESDPAAFPVSLGGNTDIEIYLTGTGTSMSFSVTLSIGDEEMASGSTNDASLLSGLAHLYVSLNIPETKLDVGDTVSLEIEFSASMSRGAQIEFGEGTYISTSSGKFPMGMEVHAHGGSAHIIAHISPPWGPETITFATAAIIAGDQTTDYDPTSQETVDGVVNFEWSLEEVPDGELIIMVTITDVSGNIHLQEFGGELGIHDHEHSGIMVSSGSITLLILVIAGVMGVGYIGGITPLSSFFDERKMRYLLAFAAGVFIATSLFHALPESLEMSGWWALIYVGLGFASLYTIEHWVIDFLDKKFRKSGHSHQFQHTGVKLHLHDHHSKDHEILTNGDVDPSDMVCSHHMENTSEAAFFGVGLHNLIEGIVITTLFMNPDTQAIGLIVILATVLHKAPCTFSIASLLKMAGNTPKQINKKILIVLGMTPVGAVLALLIFMRLDAIFVGFALAFSAGTFLEIGLLDLMPESVKPKKNRWIALVAIALGFGLLWLFSLVHVH